MRHRKKENLASNMVPVHHACRTSPEDRTMHPMRDQIMPERDSKDEEQLRSKSNRKNVKWPIN